MPLDMDTRRIRVARIRSLIASRFGGNASKLADAIDVKASQLSRWITPNEEARQAIAEASARAIESKLGLPTGYLDQHHDFLNNPKVFEIAQHLSSWPDEKLDALVAVLGIKIQARLPEE